MMTRFADLKTRFSGVHDLIKFRVTELLLISTAYDGFVLEEDGQLTEQIYNQFADLSIPYIPRIHRVSRQDEALDVLANRTVHLIITCRGSATWNHLSWKNRSMKPIRRFRS